MNRFSLAAGEVHSWCVPLDAPRESAGLDATLSTEERNRSARFRFAHDRRRYVIARGVLRTLLGRYLGTHPSRLAFVCSASGKPELSPECGSRLRFNLSHSADLALIGVAHDADVGVDVEQIRPCTDYAGIAREWFSAAEVHELSQVSSGRHAEAFLSCWTKKEARVKASGAGLATPEHRPWSVYTLRPAPGYVGALAIEPGGWRLSEWQWRC